MQLCLAPLMDVCILVCPMALGYGSLTLQCGMRVPSDRCSYSLWAAVFCPIKCGGQVAVLVACPVFRFCAPAQEGAHKSQIFQALLHTLIVDISI